MYDADEHVYELMSEIERLKAENEWLKSRFRICSPHMNGQYVWCPTNPWPNIIGPTIEEAVRNAMKEETNCD